jgi:hypothetical protein
VISKTESSQDKYVEVRSHVGTRHDVLIALEEFSDVVVDAL